MTRYALYYTPPPDAPLARLGAAILGYDVATGETVPQRVPEGSDPAAFARLMEEPRRYGFHATLKPPFRLAEGASLDALAGAVRTFAKGRAPLHAGPLRLELLGRFLALVPEAPPPELGLLAAECVAAFDPFRAPLSESDRARRLAKGLSRREAALLDRWGYPYVFERFRFHMTLTGPIEEGREAWRDRLAALVGDPGPLVIDALTLLRQDGPESRFVVVERFPFAP